jgi:hypothetical protein
MEKETGESKIIPEFSKKSNLKESEVEHSEKKSINFMINF